MSILLTMSRNHRWAQVKLNVVNSNFHQCSGTMQSMKLSTCIH